MGYIQMYPRRDIFELFDLPLDVPLVWEINQGYMAYVSLWIPLISGVKVLATYTVVVHNLKLKQMITIK